MHKSSLDSRIKVSSHEPHRYMLFVYDDLQSDGGMLDYFSGFNDLNGFKSVLSDMLEFNSYQLLSKTGKDNYQIFDRLSCREILFNRSLFSEFVELESFCIYILNKLSVD